MYILRISSKAFIQVKPDEVVITSDYEKATKYNDKTSVSSNL